MGHLGQPQAQQLALVDQALPYREPIRILLLMTPKALPLVILKH